MGHKIANWPEYNKSLRPGAKKSKDPNLQKRNFAIDIVNKYGKKEWKVLMGYHKRSLVETCFYRYKTIFGEKLMARKLENQIPETLLKCVPLN